MTLAQKTESLQRTRKRMMNKTRFRRVLMWSFIYALLMLWLKQTGMLRYEYKYFHSVSRSNAMFIKVTCNVYQQSAKIVNTAPTLREAVEQKPLAKDLVVSGMDTKPCFMKIGCPGRLGNQLFQYGFILSTASRYGYTTSPLVSGTCLIKDYFTVSESSEDLDFSNNRFLREKGAGIYNPMIESLDTRYNWTMEGFFQSWRYLDAPLVKSRLTFKPSIMFVAKSFLQIMTTDNMTTVGIHVRRGDFLVASEHPRGYTAAGIHFIKSSMNHYRRALNRASVVFIVLSDEIGWCKKNIKGSDVIFSPFSNPGVDLAIMSLLDHAIVTGGTFGWWGGFLCKGSVVYYRDFPTPGSEIGNVTHSEDFYPPQWIPMR